MLHDKTSWVKAGGKREEQWPAMEIVLEHGEFRLALMPLLGGSVRSFSWAGVDILRPAQAGSEASPLETAGFPLFPYSGRICDGRFDWHGRTIQLEPNFPPEAHAIHGHAWLNPWTLEDQGPGFVRIAYDHVAGTWPWSYRAAQTFELTDDGVRLELALTNLSDGPMPAGLGWHPYFPRGDAVLQASVSGIWAAERGALPERPSPVTMDADISGPVSVDTLELDNAFSASPANARIVWPGRGIQVDLESSAELGHLVVYIPAGADFFCVEPVSHAPNAVNSALERSVTGLRELAPGETLTALIRLKPGRV